MSSIYPFETNPKTIVIAKKSESVVVKIDDSMHQKLKHKVIDKKMSLKDYMKLLILNDLDDKKE